MSNTFQCGDHTALVGYLYGESDAPERAAIGAHVAICAACAAELAALESTREQLAAWTPPDAELGFAITRAQAPGVMAQELPGASRSEAWTPRPAAWWRQPPLWAQLAAATVIFATGLWLGVAQGIRSAARQADPAPAVAARDAAAPAAAGHVPSTELTALEQRLREEIAQLRAGGAARAAAAPAAAEAQLLARVRALIDESEQRQQRELALRTAQILRDFDSQRRVDLEQIQRTFGQIEGLTGAEVREQRQMLNYLLRVSQQR